ncbi:MAG: phosphodiester glycosidase family protein [Muribaculaceae bacterium]|nr:phosphodiester glycosidase family protein [Muribaculaceae bacterium]
MNKLLLLLTLSGATVLPSMAETVNLVGKDYEVEIKTDRQIGPGIRHTRYRLPAYPLNINVLTVDLTNPYNRIETTTANENSRGTESLVTAGNRQSYESHRAVGGANANFWVVGTQPEENTYTGIARNASIRNGKMVVESNQHRDKWDGGTMRSGVVALSYDKTAYIDYCTSDITVTSDRIGTMTVHQCNKGIHDDELSMYNSFYGANTQFLPIVVTGGKYYKDNGGDATEVILDFVEGEAWNSGRDINFKVVEVRKDAGKGTLGNHDLALVGRGANREQIAALQPGDIVTLKYTWTYNPGSENEVTPLVEQAVGPNALVMRAGELTAHNTNETYNSQVYSRTGYGCSADGKTVYIVVIDKSTDPEYGRSAGCGTNVMCEFARSLGCSYMANFDAGGSAEMMINGRIENKTTEDKPRAVANGWLVYSIAPEDAEYYNTVASLAFDERLVETPVYATISPKVIAYNRYGSVISYDYRDYTLSCPAEAGTCTGNTLTAAGEAYEGVITATVGDVTATTNIKVMNAELGLRMKKIHLDMHRSYPIEISATIGSKVFNYDPASVVWTVDNPDVIAVDANGTLTALAEGTAVLTGTIGNFSDSAEVTVEESNAPELDMTGLADWSAKGASGITNVTFDGNAIGFTYGSPRNPYIQLTGVSTFYSLPDEICIEFTASAPMAKVSADMRSNMVTKANEVFVEPATGDSFAAGTKHAISLPLDGIFGRDDLATYPVSLNYLRFYTTTDAANKGDHTINISRIWGKYTNYSGVESVAADGARVLVSPNPVAAGGDVTVCGTALKTVDILSTAGALLSSTACSGAEATVKAPATAGTYIIRTVSAAGQSASVLIVR